MTLAISGLVTGDPALPAVSARNDRTDYPDSSLSGQVHFERTIIAVVKTDKRTLFVDVVFPL